VVCQGSVFGGGGEEPSDNVDNSNQDAADGIIKPHFNRKRSQKEEDELEVDAYLADLAMAEELAAAASAAASAAGDTVAIADTAAAAASASAVSAASTPSITADDGDDNESSEDFLHTHEGDDDEEGNEEGEVGKDEEGEKGGGEGKDDKKPQNMFTKIVSRLSSTQTIGRFMKTAPARVQAAMQTTVLKHPHPRLLLFVAPFTLSSFVFSSLLFRPFC
jgi:hypothetical protein